MLTYVSSKLGKINANMFQVIKGWDEGVEGMCIGEKRALTIPPQLAYGQQGVGDVIPGGATLVFGIELVNIEEGTINPATSNIESNSGSSHGSGGYGQGFTGASGGVFNQGFRPTNQYKPNEQSGLNNILPFGDTAQNIFDLIPGLGTGVTLVNGVNGLGTGIGQYLNQLGNNINRPLNNGLNQLGLNQNQQGLTQQQLNQLTPQQLNQLNQQIAQAQRPTGLANNNALNCNNNNFNVNPQLCPNFIPESDDQLGINNNRFNPLTDCRFNPLVPCPGATPVAGPGQGSQPTFRLPTGQGWSPAEQAVITCKYEVLFSILY